MNLLKKFVRNDNADLEEDYDDIYVMPEDLKMEMPDEDSAAEVSAINDSARVAAQPVATEKVALKLLQPKSHTEATKIADRLKDGCIVLLDISSLTKDKACRLVDFLAGVAYVLGGEMIKTNKNTIVVAPAGVDISNFASEEPEEVEEAAEEYEEVYAEGEQA